MSTGSGELSADFWAPLRTSTPARIGLGRAGDSLPTREVLALRSAHAAARDAVHLPLDVEALVEGLCPLGLPTFRVASQASDRSAYLRRPDLGRLPADLSVLPEGGVGYDVGIMLADGLSARALDEHGAAMASAIVARCRAADLSLAPLVIAEQARVALGDHVGERLGVRTLVVVIGERPGLSVAASLGLYLTHAPSPGRRDSMRNCISNVHPLGLSYERAADVLIGLVHGARALGESGVRLKDTSAAELPTSPGSFTELKPSE